MCSHESLGSVRNTAPSTSRISAAPVPIQKT